jgi:hypothetical protein
VNPGQIEVDKERSLRAIRDWRAFRPELRFNPVEQAAPDPVELALSKNWTVLDTSFVSPQGNGGVAICTELVVSLCLRISIGTPPWHGRGIDVNERSIRSVVVVDGWRLRAGVCYEEAGLGGECLNI